MATYVNSAFNFDHTSDAGYRAWVQALITALATVNPSLLSQTSDTGQINTATATKPGSLNTTNDYFIFKLNDGIGQPLYLKFYVGTGPNGNQIATKLEVGTGTNGAGVITGQLTLSSQLNGPTVATVGGIYASVVAGSVFLAAGCTATSGGIAGVFVVQRSADASGNFNADGAQGVTFNYQGASYTFFSSDISGASKVTSSNYVNTCAPINPYGKTTTGAAGVVKPMPVFGAFPDIRIAPGMAALATNDISLYAEFSVAMVGATARNFKYLGAGSTFYLAAIWE